MIKKVESCTVNVVFPRWVAFRAKEDRGGKDPLKVLCHTAVVPAILGKPARDEVPLAEAIAVNWLASSRKTYNCWPIYFLTLTSN